MRHCQAPKEKVGVHKLCEYCNLTQSDQQAYMLPYYVVQPRRYSLQKKEATASGHKGERQHRRGKDTKHQRDRRQSRMGREV